MQAPSSQPEVYETEDLPPDLPEAGPIREVENTEDIDNSRLPSSTAFRRFAGKSFETRGKNFSDAVGQELTRQKDYQTEGSETAAERLQRLRSELEELVKDLEENPVAKEKLKEDGIQDAELEAQMAHLRSLLQRAEMAFVPKGPALSGPSQGALDVTRTLISEIQGFASSEGKVRTAKPSPADSRKEEEGRIVYELFAARDPTRHAQMGHLAAMERRLAELESLVGRPVPLESPVDLSAAVVELRKKLRVLTGAQLDALQARLTEGVHRLDDLHMAAKREEETRPGEMSQISELYQMMKRWDTTMTGLPAFVERLKALHELHRDAVSFDGDLRGLENGQEEINRILREENTLLTKVEECMQKNMSTILSNVKQLEKRIGDLGTAKSQGGKRT